MKTLLNEINFGPQHPAAHGVMRAKLYLRHERIYRTDIQIGLLHRSTEKLIEFKNFFQALPYFNRLDYVSACASEEAFSLAVEKLSGFSCLPVVQITRIILAEITRILNHLLALTTHALDVGALTPFLWGFEEREKFMVIYEQISGSRLHTAYIRPFTVNKLISFDTLIYLLKVTQQFQSRLDELQTLLQNNPIWRHRLKGIGAVDSEKVLTWGLTGVFLRAIGVPFDLRKVENYNNYTKFNFTVPIAKEGDSLARFNVRMAELRQSLSIIKQGTFSLLALTSNYRKY